jgi:simple sugar transport system ATP-binding protein
MPSEQLLSMTGICKTFPGVRALHNVEFHLNKGEIHALMGENGAGKSTLIKVLTGVEQLDTGIMTLDGQSIRARSPQHAQQLGISTVYQEVNLCPNLSVAENIFIGREPFKAGRIDWKVMNVRAAELLKRMDISIDVTQSLGSYPVAIQQMVAIARALDISARVLILDEPTSSLDAKEVEKLFQVMRQLKANGLGIIFITHFLEQVYAISDRITILRNGELVGSYDTVALPKLELVSKMIGKELDDLEKMTTRKSDRNQSAQALVEARGLGLTGSVKPIDLEIRPGEVLGFAGLLGSGRSETAQLLFGLKSPDSGTLTVDGEQLKGLTPFKSIEKGIGMCPENRKADGIVDELTVRENIVLALQAGRGWLRFLSKKQQYELADKYIKALNISTPHADQPVKNLSGGNQQKVILARWLATNPKLLILDEPTRGIDVGTKTEIQKLVLSLAAEGKSILFISSELDEVIRCSQRVAVLRDREKVGELQDEDITEGRIMGMIAGRQA